MWNDDALRGLIARIPPTGTDAPAVHWAVTAGPVVRVGQAYVTLEAGVTDLDPKRFQPLRHRRRMGGFAAAFAAFEGDEMSAHLILCQPPYI